MKVRTKLTFGFSLVVILVWIAVFLAVTGYRSMREEVAVVEEDIIPTTVIIADVSKAAGDAYYGVMGYVNYGTEKEKQSTLANLEHLEQLGQEHLARKTGFGYPEQDIARGLLVNIRTFKSAATAMISFKERGVSLDELEARSREIIFPTFDAVTQQIGIQIEASMARIAVTQVAVDRAYSSGLYTLFLSAGLVVLLALVAAIVTTRSIVKPLYALHRGTEMIAQGNLDYKVGTRSKDEIGQLSRAFDQMTHNLAASTTSIDKLNQEITERKRGEEALRESEEKYRAIFEQASDSIVLIDMETLGIVDFNDKASESLGYSREEFSKLKIIDIDSGASVGVHERHSDNLSRDGVDSFETKHRTKSGDMRDVMISLRAINIGGRALVVSIWHDVTERKQAGEKLKKTLANLEHSNIQLAATNKELEAFSYSVSHDLRSPLRTINGFSQALLEDYQDNLDEQGKDYLSRLRNASQKMGEIIDGLLKLSRLTRSEMRKQKVDLSALARDIMTMLQKTQPKRHVDVSISRRLTVMGDRQLLRAVLENLLGNAWKFTSKRRQPRIEFGATRNGDRQAYFVRDNGAGFDMAYADNLFGAFQRLHTDAEFPGTGIGLATVQRVIHRHGGEIWAEAAVDKGATFYFTLN